MKKFNSIQDFAIIKCEAKACNDALRELHHKANEIIYNHAQQYAFPRNVQMAIDELTKIFVEIKDLEVPTTVKAKQEEILQKGRKNGSVAKSVQTKFYLRRIVCRWNRGNVQVPTSQMPYRQGQFEH